MFEDKLVKNLALYIKLKYENTKKKYLRKKNYCKYITRFDIRN